MNACFVGCSDWKPLLAMLHFVENESEGLDVRPRVSGAGARAIRSHAMKTVRRRQREKCLAGTNVGQPHSLQTSIDNPHSYRY